MGHITDKRYIGGLVFPDKGIVTVQLPNNGMVNDVYVNTGDHVNAGEELAMVSVGSANSIISSPCSGIVLGHKGQHESFVQYEPIFNVLSQETPAQVRTIVAYAPFTIQRELRVGMEIQATPTYDTREKIGYVSGRITNIAKFPINRQEALQKLKLNDFLDDIFPKEGSVFEISIELNQDSTTHDGLAWSFEQNIPVEMSVGTFCNIQVITKDRSVYDYLFENIMKEAHYVKMLVE